MAYYKDLRGHLEAIDKQGLLVRIQREINKDTELMPLVRWQFRGLPEEERKAFFFENVVDAKGKQYDIPVVVGAYAATRRIYAMGLGCEPEEVLARWEYALSHPLDPVFVSDAPAQEEVHTGEELTRAGGGLDAFPVPISTPGFDCAPYTTCSCLVTKDIDTGIQNVGNYRGQVKARNRIGMNIKPQKDAVPHWRKCKDKGIPLEFALVIGLPPAVAATGVSEVPRGVDEHTIAGGLVGEPIPVVKCKTVDLFVPADSELVLEGLISTEYMEPEAPFGESHGYMNPRELGYILDIKAITHRKNCIFAAWISEVTPSESSAIKRDAYAALFLRYLKLERRIPSVTRVMMHEPLTNLRKVIVIQMKSPSKEQVWRALYSATQFEPRVGKIIIAVDEDINPEDVDAVLWAMAYRMKPHEDVNIVPYRDKGHGPPFIVSETEPAQPSCNDSALLIDATLKEPFPPVSLPKRQFMERAKQIWEELGLPKLKPQSPWFGYSLGQWSEEWDEEARLAVEGEHYITGEKLFRRRVRV